MIIIKLEIPCSYQGGKQRISSNIVNIIFRECKINNNTKFFDLCCGSGAFSIELINRGINPENIIMIDAGCMGAFWESISKNTFDIDKFYLKLKKIPNVDEIKEYLENLSSNPVNKEDMVYDYLILQSGAFGSKQIWVENDTWKNCSFRNYWMPNNKSNRKYPVNPMMPMPKTLFNRVKNIANNLSGKITAHYGYIEEYFDWYFDYNSNNNAVIYLDPPYKNTTGYGFKIDITNVIGNIWNNIPIFVSEGYKIDNSTDSWMISDGRKKGNISGSKKKCSSEEWLNLFY